jgi:hypothetical protein
LRHNEFKASFRGFDLPSPELGSKYNGSKNRVAYHMVFYNFLFAENGWGKVEDRMPKQAFTDRELCELVGLAKAEGVDRSQRF